MDGDIDRRDRDFDYMSDGDYGEEPDFSDPEDYSDDICDEELLEDIWDQKPKESDGFDSVIVVDGIPCIAPDRHDKLKNIIRKLYSKFGNVINEHYPLGSKNETKGYVFLEFDNHESAVEAVQATDGTCLDKSHTFLVNLFSDFVKYETIPEEWEEPKPEPYQDQGNLKSWLLDQDACDQFSVVSDGGKIVSVISNTVPEAKTLHTRTRWTESFIKWSPLGTYLATLHSKGVALWGGEDFHQIARFSHRGVQYIDFSPNENYLVTFNARAVMGTEPCIVIWETRTRTNKRIFNVDASVLNDWPIFLWSHNDKYFARISEGVLSVYETPSCGLLDKKSIKVPGMMKFSWSPTDNILGYWVAEDKDVPARVTLIEIPSRKEIRVKNLFNVANCQMHWQKSGDYLCVMVDRYSKLRKEKGHKYAGIYYNFEIFHMREKQIPVDGIEIKETVSAVAWEPVGDKLAIIHGEQSNMNVSFYGVKSTPVLLKKYERKSVNHLFWSPTGQFVVIAGLRSLNGVMEFVDTSDFTSMNSGDHFMCTDIEWDPTGRYIMTGERSLNGFPWINSINFVGDLDHLRFSARKKISEVKKNLKKYSVVFDAKDRTRMSTASKELMEKRQAKYKEYEEYRSAKMEEYIEMHAQRLELRNGMDTDKIEAENAEMEEEIVEFLVKEQQIVMD
ncbi:EIF3B [Lepeophtheirus salmonis]|uniref:Eukaryotic translation initiation factor 3 subunit B n=1 Tax=Lepeophtheirus salmonis TaxID=72036 RepID=A0A7R8CAV8_LEPSM|nr:EIF3B [Lepeophtheirus salmonis]CAF2752486.1 EIF3B [Lepeophtheirus salmonis]